MQVLACTIRGRGLALIRLGKWWPEASKDQCHTLEVAEQKMGSSLQARAGLHTNPVLPPSRMLSGRVT